MVDYDDVGDVAENLPGCGGLFGAIFLVILVSWLLYTANQNDNECAKKQCDFGKPELLYHECLCVDKAK